MPEGEAVSLKKWPTDVEPLYKSKKHCKERPEAHVDHLSELQRVHYASNR